MAAEPLRTDVEGRCPFCQRTFSVRWGNPPADPGHLLHALPMCDAFERMSGDEFVAAVVKGAHRS
jgi:hypothetical protein